MVTASRAHLGAFDYASQRAFFAQRGVELRRDGKLPPLKDVERWEVWMDHFVGSRAEAEARQVELSRGALRGAVDTVKPYPDAKQAPVLPPYDCGVHPPEEACACRGRAIAEPAKVDPYATHRLAGEHRRAELTRKIEANAKTIGLLKTELDAWVSELDRLDKPR